MEFTFCLARALGNICAPGLLKLQRGWGDVVEKVRGLCFPSLWAEGSRERAADGYYVLHLDNKQEGQNNMMLPVPPSGPCSDVEWMRLGLSCGDLGPCSFSSCGRICWAVNAWLFFIVTKGVLFPFGWVCSVWLGGVQPRVGFLLSNVSSASRARKPTGS